MPTLIEWVVFIISIITLALLVIFIFIDHKKKSVLLSKENLDIHMQRHEERLNNVKTDMISNLQNSITLLSSLLNEKNEKESKLQMDKLDLLITTLTGNLKSINDTVSNNNIQTEQKLENIRSSVENSITKLQNENTKKLDEMRNVVEEKLQKTLDDKLSQSFSLVSERLEQVYKGLGEMQNLAVGVGDLKKVLSNVKTRGILGEIQLGNILEQILTKEQYEENIITKKGTANPVEFAIKLPGDGNDFVYLPIDAKFPLDTYEHLLKAYEIGDSDAVKSALNNLTSKIKKFAKDINNKYIDVPHTTEFGIMFIPVEGLYAEIVKSGVTEVIQREYKINIAGPTTMAALLNSLQMGFKTLSIQKRSSEVWKVLGAVKTEFKNFKTVLDNTQKKLNQATEDLEKLVGAKTRKIQKSLDNVTEITDLEARVILEIEE